MCRCLLCTIRQLQPGKGWMLCRYCSRNTRMTENMPWFCELRKKPIMSPKSSKLCVLKGDQVQVFLRLNTSVVIHTDLLTINRCRLLPNHSYSQIYPSKTCLSEKKNLNSWGRDFECWRGKLHFKEYIIFLVHERPPLSLSYVKTMEQGIQQAFYKH